MSTEARNSLADVGLLLIRMVLAAVFIYHGGQKLFGIFGGYGISGTAGWMGSVGIPLPTLSATLAGGTEFFGGIVLLLGTGARIAAVPMAFCMLVAVTMVHRSAFDARSGGMEYALTLGVVLVSLALIGPGRLTLGRLLCSSTRCAAAPQPARA